MHTLVIYVHPSEQSFTAQVRDEVVKTLEGLGHTWEVSDLYKQNFITDMSEDEYMREAFYKKELPLPADVQSEQQKILRSQNLIFIYPVFWTEAPAKLVGWFDRVWTVGFAYEDCTMPQFENVQFLAIAGNTMEHLEGLGFAQAMHTVMCKDRINTRAKKCDMHIFSETSRGMPNRENMLAQHLKTAREIVQGM